MQIGGISKRNLCNFFTTLNWKDFVEQLERVLRFSSDMSTPLVGGIFKKMCVQQIYGLTKIWEHF